jgi:7-cyano-7-deazaguanine synthase in queuosine biosynthesis
VKLDFNYDLSLGRQHLAFLSGGLDSRMGLYAAAKEGFKDIHCLNFSQRGYPDQTIAARICEELGCELHYKALDGGDYLLRLEDNASYNDAQIILHGSEHLYQAIRSRILSVLGYCIPGRLAI